MNVDDKYVGKDVGFTGTRVGLTDPQKEAVRDLLRALYPRTFRHGDCIGADAQAALIANAMTPRPALICHPPLFSDQRAGTAFNDQTLKRKGFFERNRDIGDACEVLIGCPQAVRVRLESGGTWYTINYVEKLGKPIFVAWPDGTVSTPEEGLPK
jgi:hypothetical protein